jgi:hypothetical protein
VSTFGDYWVSRFEIRLDSLAEIYAYRRGCRSPNQSWNPDVRNTKALDKASRALLWAFID